MGDGGSTEEIDGFLRRCGNVIFTKTHEIIEGRDKPIERRHYKTEGRCPGIWPEVWSRMPPDEKAQNWKEWRQQWGDPPPVGAAPGRRDPAGPPDRTIVEFCCGHNSRIGQPRNKKPGCRVVRLTVDDDLRKRSGMETALKAVREHHNVLLWVAIPCTGGCPWQRINSKRSPETAAKIKVHKRDVQKM